MARFVKRWWKAAGLCAAAALGLAFAARALDHALLDARVDPPDVVSVGGALSVPVPTAEGVALVVNSGDPIRFLPSHFMDPVDQVEKGKGGHEYINYIK